MAERDPRYFKVYQDGDDRELEQKIQQVLESGAAPGIDTVAREGVEEIQRMIENGEIGGGGGGAGVDNVARQEIQEVSEKLADKVDKAYLTGTNISKDIPFTIGGLASDTGIPMPKANRIRMSLPVFLKKGTKISLLNRTNYSYNIILYTEAVFNKYHSAPLGSAWYTEDYVVPYDIYVCVMLRFNDDRAISNVSDFPIESALYISDHLTLKAQNIESKAIDTWHLSDGLASKISTGKVYPRYTQIQTPFRLQQDGCIVGEEIWFFYGSDTEGAVSDIKRISKNDYTELPSLQHSIGHANSVDCIGNHLMTYDPDSEKLYLYRDPGTKSILKHTDPECLIMSFKKAAKDGRSIRLDALGGGMCFGENEKILYYLAYDKANTDKPMTVYKILLGMGANDLSDKTANGDNLINFGTFQSGKPDSQYNGTAKVLHKFTGTLSGRMYSRPQGMTFDGNIYVSAGFERLHCYEIALNYETNSYGVKRDIIPEITNVQGNPIHIESEIALIDGNSLIMGGFNSTDSFLTKVNI